MGFHTWLRRRRTVAWASPPDCGWRSATLAVVDVETTGLDLARDQIVALGIVFVRGGRIRADRFYTAIKPTCPVTPAAMKVHCLTAGELADAPALAAVLDRVRPLLRDAIVVAHAAWVERAFLDRALHPYGERVPDTLVDTAALARHLGFGSHGPSEPSLEWLSRTLDLPVHTPHHALGDALTTAQVLVKLISLTEHRAGTVPVSVSTLQRISQEWGN